MIDSRELADPSSSPAWRAWSCLRSVVEASCTVAPQPVHRLQRRVCLASRVRAGGRPAAHQLEALRPAAPALRQGVRRRHQPEPVHPAGRQRLDGLREPGSEQAALRRDAGRRAGAPGDPAARRRGRHPVRRPGGRQPSAAGEDAPAAGDPRADRQRRPAGADRRRPGHSPGGRIAASRGLVAVSDCFDEIPDHGRSRPSPVSEPRGGAVPGARPVGARPAPGRQRALPGPGDRRDADDVERRDSRRVSPGGPPVADGTRPRVPLAASTASS